MMGLVIYNSEGKVTFSPESRALFLSEKSNAVPPLSRDLNTTYFYDTLKSPPKLIGPEEPFGLQTMDSSGQLHMDPRRRPLTFTNVQRITHTFPGGPNPHINASTPWYFIGPAAGKAVVFLNSSHFDMVIQDYEFAFHSISVALDSVIKVEGGNFYVRVDYSYYEWGYETGYIPTYVDPFSLDLVVGLTSVPR